MELLWTYKNLARRFSLLVGVSTVRAAKTGGPTIKKGISAYSYRHKFIVEWLEANRPIDQLCGQWTSLAMIQKHYGHIGVNWKAILASLNSIRPAAGEVPGQGGAVQVRAAWSGHQARCYRRRGGLVDVAGRQR